MSKTVFTFIPPRWLSVLGALFLGAFGLTDSARAWTITASPVWYKYTDMAAEYGGGTTGYGWELSDRLVYAEYWDEHNGSSIWQRIYFEHSANMEIGSVVGNGFVAVRLQTINGPDIFIGLDDAMVYRDVTPYINPAALVGLNWMAGGYVGGTLSVPDSSETRNIGSNYTVKSARMDWRSDYDNGSMPAYERYAYALVRTYLIGPSAQTVSASVNSNLTTTLDTALNELGTWTIRKQVKVDYADYGWLNFDHDYVVGTINVTNPNVAPTTTWYSYPGSMTANTGFTVYARGDSNGDNDVAGIRIWRTGESETTGEWVLSDYGQNYGWLLHYRNFSLPGGNYTFYAKSMDKAGVWSPVITFQLNIPVSQAPNTNMMRNGVDLSAMYNPKSGGNPASRVTEHRVNGVDLNEIFNRIEDANSSVYRDFSNILSTNPTALVNYQNQPLSTVSATLPDGSTGNVIQFGGAPFHAMIEMEMAAQNFIQDNSWYVFGFWARTTSGTRHIGMATTRGADGLGLESTDALGEGTQFIDTEWRWCQIERYYTAEPRPWARLHFIVGGSGGEFQIYKPIIVKNRLSGFTSRNWLTGGVTYFYGRWPDLSFVFAPLNGL